MLTYLSYFSRPFLLAVALWPFASFVLTVPLLALLYNRYNRIRPAQALVAYGTVLYFLGLLCFTMYPMPSDPAAYCAAHHLRPQLDLLGFVGDIRSDGLSAVLQLVLNVAFFLPLGWLMGRVWRWRFRVALPFAFCVSLTIETLQLTGLLGLYPCSYRLFDVDDLLTNTSGAVLGFVVALVANRLFPVRESDLTTVSRPGFVRRCIAYVIDTTLASLAASSVSILCLLAYHDVAMGGAGPWSEPRVTPHVGLSDAMMLVALAVFELVVPWLRGGATLGGSFTHMTCETRPRSGWRRAVFLLARFACVAVVAMPSLFSFSGLAALALLVFYAFARRMPYDLLPADDGSEASDADGRTVGDAAHRR